VNHHDNVMGAYAPSLIRATVVLLAAALVAVLLAASFANPAQAKHHKKKGVSTSTSTLNFGNVTTGDTLTKSVKVTNDTGKTITVPVDALSGKDFSLVSLGDIDVLSGESKEVPVVFNPLAKGTSKGVLTIVDDAGKTLKKVNLKGTGI
jgi:hypothetical protein